MPVEEWQVIDYRDLTLQDLFDRLSSLGLELNPDSFVAYSLDREDPEEFTKTILLPNEKDREKVYPLIFELWRRLLPRETISIFCDDLDHLIWEYEEDLLEDEEKLQIKIFELSDLLDGHVDTGYHARTIFKKIADFFACDLENFLYNYIYDQVDKGNTILASELLDNFYEYMESKRWFDFLRLKLLSGALTEDSTAMMARFLESLKEDPDVELYLELLRYLVKTGHNDLFKHTYLQVVPHLKTNDQFIEMLEILFDFFHFNDLAIKEETIKELIKEKASQAHSKKLSHKDKAFLAELVSR